ncbi:hypothetical protein [Streptomyces sp. NPDC056938]|uniref:hypothetical protein n=1 Tax=unclassified Streptomyces TaxID=2593676 RepID=UPI00362DE23F
MPAVSIRPAVATLALVCVAAGDSNFVSNNHMVSNVASNHGVLDSTTTGTTALDSGSPGEIKADTQNCTIRPTP